MASFGLVFATVVRFGVKSGVQPWDGEIRALVMVLLLFLPRMLRLPLPILCAFNVIAVVALEIFLMLLLKLYGYNCFCYYHFGRSVNKVRLLPGSRCFPTWYMHHTLTRKKYRPSAPPSSG